MARPVEADRDIDLTGFFVAALGYGESEASSAPFDLEVLRGKWSVKAPRSSRLEIYRGELNGRTVWPVRHMLDLVRDQELTILFDEDPVVWVVDGESGQEIEEVRTTVAREQEHQGLLPHPGTFGGGPPSMNRRAPFPAAVLDSPGVAMITADGYTWGSICLPGAPESSSLVVLERAGSLRLSLLSALPDSVTWVLRLRDPALPSRTRALYEIPLIGAGLDFDLRAVREGTYGLEIVQDARTPGEILLYSEGVRVHRDTETFVQVDLANRPERPRPAEVVILVEGDEEALSTVASVSIRPIRVRSLIEQAGVSLQAPRDVAEARAGSIEFQPRSLSPGIYLVQLRPSGRVVEMAVPDDTLYLHEIHLGPAAEYTISIKDAETGRPVQVESCAIQLSDRIDGELRYLPPGGRTAPVKDGLLSFRSEAGYLRVFLDAPGFGRRNATLDGRRQRHFELRLAKTGVLRVRLTSGGEPCYAREEWWTGLWACSGSGAPIRTTIEFGTWGLPGWFSEARLFLEESGTATLEIPALPGRSSGSRVSVEVLPGPSTVEIDAISGRRVE